MQKSSEKVAKIVHRRLPYFHWRLETFNLRPRSLQSNLGVSDEKLVVYEKMFGSPMR